MANFRTHVGVGTVVSGLFATLALAAALVSEKEVFVLALAGALGSVLPDIDLQKSRPSRMIFFFLGLFFAFCVLFAHSTKYSIIEMWLIWVASFLGVRYFLQYMFHVFAVHRGIFHSILAAVFFLFATTAIFFHVFGQSTTQSWLAGIFVFIGYMVHLTLDEIYSVDFDDTRVKRSFGTALKLFDYKKVGCSSMMAASTIAAFLLSPSFKTFYDDIGGRDVFEIVSDRLLPEGTWFGLDETFDKIAESFSVRESGAQPLADETPTGSISTGPVDTGVAKKTN